MIFCLECFANVLHQASKGEYIDCKTQLGVHVSGNEGNRLREAIKESLTSDPRALESKKGSIKACSRIPLILEAFHPPGGTPCSKHIHRCLAPGVFKKFLDKCHDSELMTETCLQAAINTGLVELVKKHGMKQDAYLISMTWNCDLRRFIPPYKRDILGFHQTPVVYLMPTPATAREIFWFYAKKLNEQLHLFYTSGEDLQQHVISLMMDDLVRPEDYFDNKPFPVMDYAFVNGGDLSPLIHAHSEQFSISDVYMMSSAHKCHYAVCHQMNMYNSAFYYTLSYDASYVSYETANMLMDNVVSVIESA